jgi:iron complex transport system ATP-binding protein
MVEIKNLCCGYNGFDVLKNISLSVQPGGLLCITGPNGCGKTTLLKSIARLIPFRGSIQLGGRETSSFSRKDLAKKTAFLRQSSRIYFPYSIYDTVALGRYAYSEGFLKTFSKEDRAFITAILHTLALYDDRDRLITELSGGQLQRVFLARTLAQDPDLILLDEPTNHLDLKHQVELLKYLCEWAAGGNKTVIAVLHDLNLVRYFGSAAVLLREGELAASGTPEEVLGERALAEIYGMDIRAFMLESLGKWKA